MRKIKLNLEEEKKLILSAKSGNVSARKEIVLKLQPLIKSIANQYCKNKKYISKEKIVTLGNMGLEKAFEHFDATENYRFSTYASWWIREAFNKELKIKDKE